MNADGRIEKVAWTELNTNIGFLALDRNGDGRIQDGSELFGNVSPQPQRIDRNGFSALAVFDQESEGGNSDQVIDFHDTIFQRLRIWIDRNHDGISAIDELATLPEVGIEGISLDFEQAIRRDANSNLFRYRSRVLGIKGAAVANWAYDVFLQVAQNSPVSRTLSRFKFAGTQSSSCDAAINSQGTKWAAGTSLFAPSKKWRGRYDTLILRIQEGCSTSDEITRTAVALRREHGSELRVVIASKSPISKARQYLKSLGLSVDSIVQVGEGERLPVYWLLDRTGRIKEARTTWKNAGMLLRQSVEGE